MIDRLLLVDDEAAILIAFKKLLQGPELVVDIADRLDEAKRLLRERPYRGVIADLRLTGVMAEEGLDLLRHVKEHHSETKVILITGYGSPAIKEKALQLGAAFYFEKPFSTAVLRDALKSLGIGA